MSRDRRPHSDRRWRIPPLPAHSSHSFAGAVVLDELSGAAGFALWQAFRDVQLWALAAPKERPHLFAPGAAAARAVKLNDAELRAPLKVLLGMVERPTTTRAEDVASACAAVSRWAEAHGATASALAFAEAAAGACPEDAALAFAAGRLARRRADFGRAETWFLRAAGLARRSGEWEPYVLGWLGMGMIQRQRGSMPRARRHYLRALRAARRHNLSFSEGQALHHLCQADMETGNLASAEAWGKEVYRVYGPAHPYLPRLAHDLAFIWSLQGFYTRAQAVFKALLPHFEKATDRLWVLSNMVRAAGGSGDREAFREAWDTASKLMDNPAAADGCATALLDMSRGAAAMGEHTLAVDAARRSAEIAGKREEEGALLDAQALLESLLSNQPGSTDTSTSETASWDEVGDALAVEIIAGLSASDR